MPRKPRIAVIGAGPAGLSAAMELARAGLIPTLIDEAPAIGGQIYRQPPAALAGARNPKQLYGADASRAARLFSDFERLRGKIDYRPQTLVWGGGAQAGEGYWLSLRADGGDMRLACDAIIIATGAMDRVLPIPGWTAPGVWSLGGAQVMLKAQAHLIGQRPIFAGSGPLLYLVAWQYAKAGARPAAVIDSGARGAKLRAIPAMLARPQILMRGLWMAADLRRRGVPVLEGVHARTIEAVPDGFRLQWSSLQAQGEAEGDAVAIGHGLKPEQQLAELLECRSEYDMTDGLWKIRTDSNGRTSAPAVYLAGDVATIRGAHAAQTGGRLAALALLQDFGIADTAQRTRRLGSAMRRQDRFRRGVETAFPFPLREVSSIPDATILCRCEGVTAGALRQAIADWQPANVNRLKALTRCGMGRCQGRLCGAISAAILAAETGHVPQRIGCLRGQPPIKPIPAPRDGQGK